MHIRPFRPGDESALRRVFESAVHGLASRDYTAEQIQAWAPLDVDPNAWAERVRSIQPFVVEQDRTIVAYADVQPSGYIDQFFVSASHSRKGIGTRLMQHLHDVAALQSMAELTSDVSRTAQPFFEAFGFVVVQHRSVEVRGISLPNAFMRKRLPERTTAQAPMSRP